MTPSEFDEGSEKTDGLLNTHLQALAPESELAQDTSRLTAKPKLQLKCWILSFINHPKLQPPPPSRV